MRKLTLKYQGEKQIVTATYSHGVNVALRDHFGTKDVQYSHGTLSRGPQNMPMVFIVAHPKNKPESGAEQFEVNVYEYY